MEAFWNGSVFWRPDSTANPCPPLEGQFGGCFHVGKLVSEGRFEWSKGGRTPVWVEEHTGARLSLIELGRLHTDWYFPDSTGPMYPDGFYVYENFPVPIGYDISKVNKLSLSSNIAGVLSPCVFACPEGGPVCAVGVVAVLWDFIGGMMSFTSNKDQLSAADMSKLEDVSLDLCSSFPIAGWPCSAFDLSKDIESGTIYAGQE